MQARRVYDDYHENNIPNQLVLPTGTKKPPYTHFLCVYGGEGRSLPVLLLA